MRAKIRFPNLLMSLRKYAVVGALLIACVLTAMLGRHTAVLRGELAIATDRISRLVAGRFVPPLDLVDIEGEKVRLGEPSGKSQLLFLFTTTCERCLESLDSVKALASAAGRMGGIAVIGVSMDSLPETREYAKTHNLEFPIVRLETLKQIHFYRAFRVPQIAIVDRSGRIVFARSGVMNASPAVDSVRIALRTSANADLASGGPQ